MPILDGCLFYSEASPCTGFILKYPPFFSPLFVLKAGAYYPAQPQYSPSVQPPPVMINPAQQPQQAPPPQPPQTQSQGPPKRERKPVVCRNKRPACLLSEVKNLNGSKCFVCSVWNFLFNLKITIEFIMLVGSCRSAVAGQLHTAATVIWLHGLWKLDQRFPHVLTDKNTRPQPGRA